MGLDMYLQGIPKVEGYSYEQIRKIDALISRRTDPVPLSDIFDGNLFPKEDLKLFEPLEQKEVPYEYDEMGIDVGTHLLIELGYWRKANQIHGWFVENIQAGEDDGKTYFITKEHLKELQILCQTVLEKQELAPELLPTVGGFFFGNYEYNEWYFKQLRETLDIIKTTLSTWEKQDMYVVYWSSW